MHKTWEQAVEVLEDFWMNEKNGLSSTPDISGWLNDAKKQKNFSASPEAARRYYSVKHTFFNILKELDTYRTTPHMGQALARFISRWICFIHGLLTYYLGRRPISNSWK